MAEKPMLVTVQASSIPALEPLIRQTEAGNKHLVIEKDGQQVAALIPIDEYNTLMKEREEKEKTDAARLKRFEQIAREIGTAFEPLSQSEEEVMADFERTRQHLFEERYGRRPKDNRP